MRIGEARQCGRRNQRGFGYLLVLFAVAALGLALAGAGQVWQTVAQREKEAELLFIGNQFRQALGSYYEHAPDGVKKYPLQLQDLVEDRRSPAPLRHLRKVYRDPMTGGTEWGLLRAGGRIVGVHSLAEGTPFRRFAFAQRDARLEGASRYDAWVFGHDAPAAPGAAATADTATGSGAVDR